MRATSHRIDWEATTLPGAGRCCQTQEYRPHWIASWRIHTAAPNCLQVEKEKDSLRLELSNAKSNINDAEAALASQKAQLEKLNHVVAEADAGAP